jgi:hypothetical protein
MFFEPKILYNYRTRFFLEQNHATCFGIYRHYSQTHSSMLKRGEEHANGKYATHAQSWLIDINFEALHTGNTVKLNVFYNI